MKRTDYLICFFLGIAALISRIPFTEKFQSHWDGPQFTIGIIRYSFDLQTPGAPGYPIYIGLGKFFNLFLHDPHTSIVAVSVFASIIGAITLYIVGLKMYHRRVGITAAIIFLTGSTFYFFSIAPHMYDLLITTTPLLAYSGISSGAKIWCGSNDYVNDLVTIIARDIDIGLKGISGDVIMGPMTGIGSNSVIMPNNIIPEGVTIGALSFVPTNFAFEPWSVYAGTPIRFIKKRNKQSVLKQVKLLEQ